MLLCVACGYNHVGAEDIRRAREDYAGLNAARITVTNLQTGVVEQELLFRYEGEALTYLYVGRSDGQVYREYQNGYNILYSMGGDDEEWREMPADGENAALYSRMNPFPLCRADALYWYPGQVASASANGGDITCAYADGITTVFSITNGQLQSFRFTDTASGADYLLTVTDRGDVPTIVT